MNILILGGSGFLGKHIAQFFAEEGHSVTCTSRTQPDTAQGQKKPQTHMVSWNGHDAAPLRELFRGTDIVVNLVGENIGKHPWTKARKQSIEQSRVYAAKAIVQAVQELSDAGERTPHTLIQASACGYYGLWDNMRTAPFCTESTPKGHGFLADVCELWEDTVKPVSNLGVRTCITRFAPVLGRYAQSDARKGEIAGFLASMSRPFRYYIGGTLGSGKQPLSWIHVHDVVQAVYFLALGTKGFGTFNICAPQPTNMRELVQQIASILKKPAFLRVPARALRFVLGEMAEELILNGQKAVPTALEELGFHFKYNEIDEALQECLIFDRRKT